MRSNITEHEERDEDGPQDNGQTKTNLCPVAFLGPLAECGGGSAEEISKVEQKKTTGKLTGNMDPKVPGSLVFRP